MTQLKKNDIFVVDFFLNLCAAQGIEALENSCGTVFKVRVSNLCTKPLLDWCDLGESERGPPLAPH